jgi:hypothetical protein
MGRTRTPRFASARHTISSTRRTDEGGSPQPGSVRRGAPSWWLAAQIPQRLPRGRIRGAKRQARHLRDGRDPDQRQGAPARARRDRRRGHVQGAPAVTSSSSWYENSFTNPARCPSSGQAGEISFGNIRAGQVIHDKRLLRTCKGTYHGVIGYMHGSGPINQNASGGGTPGKDGSVLLVGRFSFAAH